MFQYAVYEIKQQIKKYVFFKVENRKMRILRGKVISNAAFRVAPVRMNKHRKCSRRYLQEQQCASIHCVDALNAV